MIKLLIADDHPLVRRGLRELIAECGDMIVAAEACDGVEVMEAVRTGDFDVVLLDLNMPRKSGLETLVELKQLHPHLPVLIISGHCVEQYAPRLLRLGAAGFVSKQDAPEQLMRVIRDVCASTPPQASLSGAVLLEQSPVVQTRVTG
ncbi:response regulator [Candidatus Nitrospira bockiana]